jgi:hypothetical protein
MVYLVVGIDRRTLSAWHGNVNGRDPTRARETARSRARAAGVDLVVAAVIEPHSTVVTD